MTKQRERAPWEVDFVGLELTSTLREQYKKWKPTADQVTGVIDALLTEGCKVSLSYNVNTDSYILSITVPSPDKETRKKSFTSHAATMYDAMCVAAFKVEHLLDGQVQTLYSVKPPIELFG